MDLCERCYEEGCTGADGYDLCPCQGRCHLEDSKDEVALKKCHDALEAIILRCKEGDPKADWIPIIQRLAEDALKTESPPHDILSEEDRLSVFDLEAAAMEVACMVDSRIPQGIGFLLVLTHLGSEGWMTYFANIQREDAEKIFKELLDKWRRS